MGKRVKKICTICGKEGNKLFKHKTDYCCYVCHRRKINIIGKMVNNASRISLEKALNKIYTIKGFKYIKNKIPGIRITHICPPSILIGHKVKLVLADEE